MTVTLTELADDDSRDWPPLDLAPPYDTESPLRDWFDDGTIIFRGLIPGDAIDAYCTRFQRDAVDRSASIRTLDEQLAVGYGIGTPYLRIPELRDVAMHKALVPWLDAIHGEPMGLHLNLTGWASTQRDWHTDRYLNPPCVGDWYAGVWIACGRIDDDAGPFEYVPGSHRWPRVTRAKMLAALGEDGTDPDWPWRSERILTELYDAEIAARGAAVRRFTANKGDVLVWHSNLVHRGSAAATAGKQRRTLISHWSAVSKRCDMPSVKRYRSEHADGFMFVLGPSA